MANITPQLLKELQDRVAHFQQQPEPRRSQMLLEPIIAASHLRKSSDMSVELAQRLIDAEQGREANTLGSAPDMSAALTNEFLATGLINTELLAAAGFVEKNWISQYFGDVLDELQKLGPCLPLSTDTVAGLFDPCCSIGERRGRLKFYHRLQRGPRKDATPPPQQTGPFRGSALLRQPTASSATGAAARHMPQDDDDMPLLVATSAAPWDPLSRPVAPTQMPAHRNPMEILQAEEAARSNEQVVTDGSLAFVMGASGLTLVKLQVPESKTAATKTAKVASKAASGGGDPTNSKKQKNEAAMKQQHAQKGILDAVSAAPVRRSTSASSPQTTAKRLSIEIKPPTPPPMPAAQSSSVSFDQSATVGNSPRLLRAPPVQLRPGEPFSLDILRGLVERLPPNVKKALIVF